jgi:hypothetical protein
MLVPIILGSHKTTVSVGTGNNKYYPLLVFEGPVYTTAKKPQLNRTEPQKNGLQLQFSHFEK